MGVLSWVRSLLSTSSPDAISPPAQPERQPHGLLHIWTLDVIGRRDGILYQTQEPTELDELLAILQTETMLSKSETGYELLRFVFNQGEREISLRGGTSLSWRGARGHYTLRNPDAVMDWLSARKITFVRHEYERDLRERERLARKVSSWLEVLPCSVHESFAAMRAKGYLASPAWIEAMEREYPALLSRTRVLLELLGCQTGEGTGFSCWEYAPGKMMAAYSLEVIFAAIGDAPSSNTCEGAARLFTSFDFRKRRRQLRRRIPVGLRTLLIEHVERGGDPLRIKTIRRALISPQFETNRAKRRVTED